MKENGRTITISRKGETAGKERKKKRNKSEVSKTNEMTYESICHCCYSKFFPVAELNTRALQDQAICRCCHCMIRTRLQQSHCTKSMLDHNLREQKQQKRAKHSNKSGKVQTDHSTTITLSHSKGERRKTEQQRKGHRNKKETASISRSRFKNCSLKQIFVPLHQNLAGGAAVHDPALGAQ